MDTKHLSVCLTVGAPPPRADYSHVIALGGNDVLQALEALVRYSSGGASYEDPVAFDLIFQTDNVTGFPVLDGEGLPVPNFAPVVEVTHTCLDTGVGNRASSPLVHSPESGQCLLLF